MNHGVGIVDTHAVSARMLLDDRHDRIVSTSVCPVSLPFEHDLLPGDRHDPCLDPALDPEQREAYTKQATERTRPTRCGGA